MSDLPVTVIIPVGRSHLPVYRRAVTSAFEADKIIMVFDGDFGALHFKDYDPPLYHYWHDYPHGVCAARNTAIANAANGGLILPLDADDELLPGAIKALADAYTPGAIVYGSWIEPQQIASPEVANRAAVLTANNEPVVEMTTIAPPPERVKFKSVCHATYLFSKDDWERAGGYDPDYSVGAEDWELMLHMVRNGCNLIKVDAPIYRRHTDRSERTEIAYNNADIIKMLLKRDYGEWLHAV